MAQIGMHEAKTKLSQIVERAEAGEEIIIAPGKPAVRLTPVARTSSMAAVRGALQGQITMAHDFDELPDEFVEAFGAE
ncbi:MAG: type II toxin-antitoxin system Phd/YefM family antitoxin [Solirubrobacteraceae bacterium]